MERLSQVDTVTDYTRMTDKSVLFGRIVRNFYTLS